MSDSPQLSGNWPDMSASVREYSNVRDFIVTVRVKFGSNNWRDDQLDSALLNVFFRRKLERIIADMLHEQHGDWQISVKVDSKMVE